MKCQIYARSDVPTEQLAGNVFPVPLVVYPVGQTVQLSFPVKFLNVPTGQAKQGVLPVGEYRPTSQNAVKIQIAKMYIIFSATLEFGV